MELSEIEAFVAVVESGSINRAAQRLRLSQPTVTRRVQRLEASLGAALLDRHVKPFVLTPVGKAALDECHRLLRALDDLRAAAADGEPAGECRFGVAHALTDAVFAEPVDRVRRAFPRLTLRFITGWSRALVEEVRAGALDAAAVQLPAGVRPPAGVAGRVVGVERLVFVAPRRRRARSTVDLADLAGEPWVLNPEGCGFRAVLRQAFQRIDAPLQVAVEAPGFDLQLSLVARDVGLGLVPARALRRSRHRPKLQSLRVRGHDLRLAVWSIRRRPPARLAPALDALDDAVARAFAARPCPPPSCRDHPAAPPAILEDAP